MSEMNKKLYVVLFLVIVGVVSCVLALMYSDGSIELSEIKKDLPPFSAAQGFTAGPMQPAALYELTGSYIVEVRL